MTLRIKDTICYSAAVASLGILGTAAPRSSLLAGSLATAMIAGIIKTFGHSYLGKKTVTEQYYSRGQLINGPHKVTNENKYYGELFVATAFLTTLLGRYVAKVFNNTHQLSWKEAFAMSLVGAAGAVYGSTASKTDEDKILNGVQTAFFAGAAVIAGYVALKAHNYVCQQIPSLQGIVPTAATQAGTHFIQSLVFKHVEAELNQNTKDLLRDLLLFSKLATGCLVTPFVARNLFNVNVSHLQALGFSMIGMLPFFKNRVLGR